MIEVVDEGIGDPRVTTRDRTAQAIYYYNNNVLKARTGCKSLGNTYYQQQKQQWQPQRIRKVISINPHLNNLYRSNSSLELLYDSNTNECPRNNRAENTITSTLRREYGSHGSIDVMSTNDQNAEAKYAGGEQFLSMLQDYKPVVFDLLRNNRSNFKKSSLDYDIADQCNRESNNQKELDLNIKIAEVAYSNKSIAISPKQKSKFHRFWSTGSMGNSSKNIKNESPTEILTPAGISTYSNNGNRTGSTSGLTRSGSPVTGNVEMDEKQRRRAFAHYDCQSLMAKLGYGDKLKLLLSKRRNTTTGASAASTLGARSLTPDGDSGEEDSGDGRCNDLIESCPYFRNEIGGEEERVVSLTRSYSPLYSKYWKEPYHRPSLSCGISVLEFASNETHWTDDTCPYLRNIKTIENVDRGALYYKKYFHKQNHQNWFGVDETLGPVAISIRKEKVDTIVHRGENSSNALNLTDVIHLCRYRLIVRTSELQTLRGSVLEDAIPNLKSHNYKPIYTKEVLDYVIPEVQLSCLKLGLSSPQVEEQLLKLDEQGINKHYKVGVLYCRAGQATEEEMYNNEKGGPAFIEFLEAIGQKVRLKGFDNYKAGLDNKSDSTGLYSIYSQYQDCDIMFHVSTMLPFTPNNRQQLLRKRHIGNDIVTIVFQEPGSHAFTPKNIRSQFQHVFIVVRAVNPCTNSTKYRIAVTRSRDVDLFGPPITKDATFKKSRSFTEFLLAKVINGENAAHCSDKFVTMATRTRQAYLKDLTLNYSSSTVLESAQKFSIIPFSSKKKERWKPRFIPDATQRGAISWQVMLEDSTQSIIINCFLAISTDSTVLIDELTNKIMFVTPCKSILGWSTQTNSLRLYYHEGECITMHMRENSDRDELMEVVVRLKSVTAGCPAQELSLKRNAVGQLGFHVQPDGVVTQVEDKGLAWQVGLRQGARLVEICKVAVATLTHDQMVDLLKTSLMVTVTVIPSKLDGSPRRGCAVMNCKYGSTSNDDNHVTRSYSEEQKLVAHNAASLQQPIIGKHKKMYERSFSPPRSSNSSGYGTGSSNKSYGDGDNKFILSGNLNRNAVNSNHNNGDSLLTSLSSGQSTEDSWYEALDTDIVSSNLKCDISPSPLPAKVAIGGCSSERSFYKFTPNSKINLVGSSSISNSNTYSLPIVLDDTNLDNVKTQDDFINGEKVTCLIKAEHSHKVRRQLEQKLPQSDVKFEREDAVVSLPAENLKTLSLNDGHSTDTSSASEKAFPPSEDELSADSCGNVSPKLKSSTLRSTASSSTSCSRNNSPRLRDTGEARLRPGVSVRSSNRNSANLLSSTLQQDLMKLINLDDNKQDGASVLRTNQNSVGVELSTESKISVQDMEKYKENISMPQDKNGSNSVIFTTARPATVISNSSFCSNGSCLSKEERLSLRETNSRESPPYLPLPDAKKMDWSSLVSTATKAILQTSNDENSSSLLSSALSDFQWIDGSNELHFRMGSDIECQKDSQQEFEKYLSQLENRLMKETQRRLFLEQEIHSLKDENRRLQQESQSAAQQLRRFTEWFFQTIDKQ